MRVGWCSMTVASMSMIEQALAAFRARAGWLRRGAAHDRPRGETTIVPRDTIAGSALTAVVAMGFLVRIDPVMTALALVPLGLFGIVSTMAFKTLRPAFREHGAIRAEVKGRLTESLGGIRVIKGFHAIEREREVFHEGVMRLFANVRTTLTTSAAVTSLGTFFMGLASVLVMGYGGRLILQGSLTLGELFSFTIFLGFLVAPIVQMANIGTQMTEAFAGLDRTAELMSQPGEDDE